MAFHGWLLALNMVFSGLIHVVTCQHFSPFDG